MKAIKSVSAPFFAALLALCLLSAPASAHEGDGEHGDHYAQEFADPDYLDAYIDDNIEITWTYIGETTPSMKNSAAFMTIHNPTDKDEFLKSAWFSDAESTELHTVKMDENGIMQMREVEHFAIPAGETIVLKPGGDHIMLIGLHTQLKADVDFTLTLNFENAGEVITAIPVLSMEKIMQRRKDQKNKDAGQGHDSHGHHSHEDHGHDHSDHHH